MTLIRPHTDVCCDGDTWSAFCSHRTCTWSIAGCVDAATAQLLAQQHDEVH
jgi:hypothetical protein